VDKGDAAKHPGIHKAAPTTQIIQPQMLLVPMLRNSELSYKLSGQELCHVHYFIHLTKSGSPLTTESVQRTFTELRPKYCLLK